VQKVHDSEHLDLFAIRTCFMLVSCLAYSSISKDGRTPLKRRLTFTGINGSILTELFTVSFSNSSNDQI
jgi:hypothetical protein